MTAAAVEPEYPMDIQHSSLATDLGGLSSYYFKALHALAENPGLTNKGVATAINRPLGSMGPPCRAARETLGISDTRGANTAYIDDYDRYVQGCEALGITPQKGTAFAKVHDPVVIVRSEVEEDPMQEVRRLVRSLREQMVALDLERIEITATDTNVTRTVRTTSSFKL